MTVPRRLALVSAVLLVAGAALRVGSTGPAAAVRASPPEAQVRDLDIAFYRARAEREPFGAVDLAQLSALYLQRSRATGSFEDIRLADSTARLSLGHRTSHNAMALHVLAAALTSQHRFAEARDVALELLATDSTRPSFRAALGEIELELGWYADARRIFGTLYLSRNEPAVAPRYARWLELTGRNDEARRLLLEARAEARRRVNMPAEQLAWFDLRLGDLAQHAGHLDEAERHYAAGLAGAPDDHRLLGGVARLEAARGRWRRSIEAGERAIAQALDPATLGTLSDAYAAEGHSARAAEYLRAMELSVLRQPGALHRAWSLFLLDHDRRVPEVTRRVAAELSTRKDVYGYDLMAWALYKSGRLAEARSASDSALAQGTRDALLHYHAGMIARASGEPSRAAAELRAALEINPYFHPAQPKVARAVLDSLGG
jgi:tetratricopeptide (TPR) repeat protein